MLSVLQSAPFVTTLAVVSHFDSLRSVVAGQIVVAVHRADRCASFAAMMTAPVIHDFTTRETAASSTLATFDPYLCNDRRHRDQ